MTEIVLREASRVSVTVLVDNYVDLFLLQSFGPMRRPPMPRDWNATPLAEHGLSVLITVESGTQTHSVLMDASLTAQAVLHNLDVYCPDPSKIEGIILSHGHIDHCGGLMGVLGKLRWGCDLFAHPDAFLPRRFSLPGTEPNLMPLLDEDALRKTGAEIRKSQQPSVCCSDIMGISGHIDRITDFETGFPYGEIERDRVWSRDPIDDDQAVVLHVKDRGLVVISGCAHAGIINTVKYAQKTTGVSKVHAVMGGFHLTGPIFEPRIEATTREMKRLGPDYIVPMHCTGWKAINRFAWEMPEQFLLNSVGTTYVFS
jgi:7,8-dihydropterin-6-yl-methyl-4-(beta-D-ribofuranosyl)aminobenzene 5'-phosphate synthase